MEFEYLNDSCRVAGYYEQADGSINIAKGVGKYEAECIYYHERQHRKCHLSKCKCWGRISDYLSEYHAYRAELRDVAGRRNRPLATAYLKAINESLVKFEADPDPKIWLTHKRALTRVMRTEAYRNFLQWYHSS